MGATRGRVSVWLVTTFVLVAGGCARIEGAPAPGPSAPAATGAPVATNAPIPPATPPESPAAVREFAGGDDQAPAEETQPREERTENIEAGLDGAGPSRTRPRRGPAGTRNRTTGGPGSTSRNESAAEDACARVDGGTLARRWCTRATR